MTNQVLNCGYSYHTQPLHVNLRDNIEHYFLRLQSEGQCQAKINRQSFQLLPGDLLICKPGDHCELNAKEFLHPSGDFKTMSGDYYLMCKGEWLDEWWNRKKHKPLIKLGYHERVINLWKQLIGEKRRIHEKDEELLDYLLRCLCLVIDTAEYDSSHTTPHQIRPVMQMKYYIENHAAEPFKIADVANYAGLSVSRSAHLFRAHFGQTIIQYALDIRLNLAIDMMRYNDISLGYIAESAGFGSYAYFHRVFRNKYGMSPSSYMQLFT